MKELVYGLSLVPSMGSGRPLLNQQSCVAMAFVSLHLRPRYKILGFSDQRRLAGCGKSVLVSSIIDSLTIGGTLIFYYCDYADKRTLEPSNVFGTLTRQALEKVEILPETLASEIEQAEHDGERLTDISKALAILQKSFQLVPGPLYLILDGLDEATESSQNLICNSLK
jgi:hypothetical protein